MCGFLSKLSGKCPNCNKSYQRTIQSKNNTIMLWQHHKVFLKKGKVKSLDYCKECYEKLKKNEDELDWDASFAPVKGLECNICGLQLTRYSWRHSKMYLEQDKPPDKRAFYIVSVCDGCYENLDEKALTDQLKRTGFA